jgi:hypothetical protein
MFVKRLVLVLVFLSVSALVHAQTNYCDTTPPTSGNGTVGTQMAVSACAGPNDVNGNPVTLTSWNLYDGATLIGPIVMVKGATSAVSGLTVYTGFYTPTTAGSHTLTVTSTGNSKESAKSAAFLLTASLPAGAPTAPTKLSAQ